MLHSACGVIWCVVLLGQRSLVLSEACDPDTVVGVRGQTVCKNRRCARLKVVGGLRWWRAWKLCKSGERRRCTRAHGVQCRRVWVWAVCDAGRCGRSVQDWSPTDVRSVRPTTVLYTSAWHAQQLLQSPCRLRSSFLLLPLLLRTGTKKYFCWGAGVLQHVCRGQELRARKIVMKTFQHIFALAILFLRIARTVTALLRKAWHLSPWKAAKLGPKACGGQSTLALSILCWGSTVQWERLQTSMPCAQKKYLAAYSRQLWTTMIKSSLEETVVAKWELQSTYT